MTSTSTKSPQQLIQVLDNLLTQTYLTISLAPEIVRDLASLRDWCDDAVDAVDDWKQNAQEVNDYYDALVNNIEGVLHRMEHDSSVKVECRTALIGYAAEIKDLL
jgi:hypothetical protein